jgi:hypothetical protein
MKSARGKFDTPEARWAGVGPYYAMFPSSFADAVIEDFTIEGDLVVDPFAGRGTSIFSAATRGRHAIGIEINPVGWIYATTKLRPATRSRVESRAEEIAGKARRFRAAAGRAPEFFRWCFCDDVLAYLLAARSHLDWRKSSIDRTLMAILLVDLHGKRELAFSNQLRQTKAMSPDYAVRWWRSQGMEPPRRDPVAHVNAKLAWRYARGRPSAAESRVYLGDSSRRLSVASRFVNRTAPHGARLLFTSPPYLGITNYHYDQWLRLWLLGGPERPASLGDKHRGKFTHPGHYRDLLFEVFSNAAKLLAEDATIYIRTDKRRRTAAITRSVLKNIFPNHRMRERQRPLRNGSQTRLFGNGEPGAGEIDLVLTAE